MWCKINKVIITYKSNKYEKKDIGCSGTEDDE